jgi:NodT family efflux transporter outer membrane factor (OMF) lipoprotein
MRLIGDQSVAAFTSRLERIGMIVRTMLVTGLVLLSSCEVGPDFHRPAAPTDPRYTPGLVSQTGASTVRGGGAQHFDPNLDIPGDWWALFQSQPLDQLVRQAMAHNPDLAAAQAALRQAQENLKVGYGGLLPTGGAGFQAERELISGAAFGQPGLHETLSLVTPSLNISYPLDVFGGARRQIESLAAQADYQRFELEAAYLTLTSNVVVAAIQDASLRGQIAATREIIADQQKELALVQSKFTVGAASRADVLSQQAQLDQTRATLPPLEKQLAQTRNQLTALIGELPMHEAGAVFDLAQLRLPMTLPLTVPSGLVEQRPDIRAAEATLRAASASIGVAVANQLPQFTISGSLGTEAASFTNAFSAASGVWTIAGGITQPLFNAYALEHKKRAAVAAFEQAAAQYRSTVVKACQNVADTLRALQSDADALATQASAERTALQSLNLARSQFQAGAIDYQTLLNAQRTWQQARINLVQAEATRYADTAALFQALGGGWWHRTDVAQNP